MPIDNDLFDADAPGMDAVTSSHASADTARSDGLAASSKSRKKQRHKPTPDNYRKSPQLQDADPLAGYHSQPPSPTSKRSQGSQRLERRTTQQSGKPQKSPRKAPQKAPAPTYAPLDDRKYHKQLEKKAKAKKKAEAKAQKTQDDGARLIDRIRFYVKTSSVKEMFNDLLAWIDAHKIVLVLLSVLSIIIGLAINRYVSFSIAVATVAFGVLMTKKGYDTTFYLCVLTGFLTFFIPYMF